MKKRAPKKHLPAWVSIVMILVVIVIAGVVGYMSINPHRKGKLTDKNVADIQSFIDAGGVPKLTRKRLEGMGIKFPADYDQRVQKRNAEQGRGGSPMRQGR